MKLLSKICVAAVFSAGLAGCAHPINIAPQLDNIRNQSAEKKYNQIVGYHIENADWEVTTPGGGGDKIKYKPYKDTEAALYAVLNKVFKQVYKVDDPANKAFLTSKNITLLFKPQIHTSSSSSGVFTWPATDFVFELNCTAIDESGNQIWSTQIKESGHAESSEVLHDYALSAKRATEKAYQKLLEALTKADVFNK